MPCSVSLQPARLWICLISFLLYNMDSAEMDILLIFYLPNHHSQGGTFVSCKSLFLYPAWVSAHQTLGMMWARCSSAPDLWCASPRELQTCAHPCATLVLTLQVFPIEGENTATKMVMTETFLNLKYTFLFVK